MSIRTPQMKTVAVNSFDKPLRLGGMRIEKVLPSPDDHGSLI